MNKFFKGMFAVVIAGICAFALVGCGSTTKETTDMNGNKFGKEENTTVAAFAEVNGTEFVVGGEETPNADTNKISYTMKTNFTIDATASYGGVKESNTVKGSAVQNVLFDGENEEFYSDMVVDASNSANRANIKQYAKVAYRDGKFYTYTGENNCSINDLFATEADASVEFSYGEIIDMLNEIIGNSDLGDVMSANTFGDAFNIEEMIASIQELDESGVIESITVQTTDTAVKYNIKFKSNFFDKAFEAFNNSEDDEYGTSYDMSAMLDMYDFSNFNVEAYVVYQKDGDTSRLVETDLDMNFKYSMNMLGANASATVKMNNNYRVNSITDVNMPW